VRFEARVVEAAAEQRIAAALALQRAELVKQARSSLCMCGVRDVCCTAPAFLCARCVHRTASGAAVHAMRVAARAMVLEMSCSAQKRPPAHDALLIKQMCLGAPSTPRGARRGGGSGRAAPCYGAGA